MKTLWYKLKLPEYPSFLQKKEGLHLYYAREYFSEGSKQKKGSNSIIWNFKKSPDRKKNPQEWYYREIAVNTFAKELGDLIGNLKSCIITAIPESKTKNDPMYTHRFEDSFKKFKEINPHSSAEWPVIVKKSNPSYSSQAGKRRDPKDIIKDYQWKGFVKQTPPNRIFVCDDVLTSGAHFSAMYDFLRKNHYKGIIVGIAWALTNSQT